MNTEPEPDPNTPMAAPGTYDCFIRTLEYKATGEILMVLEFRVRSTDGYSTAMFAFRPEQAFDIAGNLITQAVAAIAPRPTSAPPTDKLN